MTRIGYTLFYMMPGSKGLNPHELAHKWMKDLGTRPKYEHKSGMVIPRYANIGEDCGSAKHETIRRHQKNIYQASKNIYIVKMPGAKGLTGI